MKAGTRILRILAAAGLATVIGGNAASACQKIYALEFQVEEGGYDLYVNGVFVSRDDGYSAGTRPLMGKDWLVQGDNTVTIVFSDNAGAAKGDFAIVTGCMGEFEVGDPIAEASFDGAGEQTLSFTNEDAVEAAHTGAEAAGDDGLAAAVKRLQEAVAARDVDTVMAMHGPLLRDAKRLGAPVERISQMFEHLITEQTAELAGEWTVEAAMDGRIYVVLTEDRQAPVAIRVEEDDYTLNWMTGVYWGRYDGDWGVVALYSP